MPSSVRDSKLWPSFELLGLADRYEALIASVCYEHIEAHVLETCAGKWDEPMLNRLREWMANKVVPWMLLPYARGAKTGACCALLFLLCSRPLNPDPDGDTALI